MVQRKVTIALKELERVLLPILTTLSSRSLTILSYQIVLILIRCWRTVSWHRRNGGVAGEDDEELIAATSLGVGGTDVPKRVVLVSRFGREAK